MARYKKAKAQELPEIAPDQMKVQDDEGNVLVIAIAGFPDHARLGWVAVPGPAPEVALEPDPVDFAEAGEVIAPGETALDLEDSPVIAPVTE